MKKVLAIFLLFAHLLSAAGVFANVHYCGSKMTGFSFLSSSLEDDCDCTSIRKTNCCDDITIKSKVNTEARTIDQSPRKQVSLETAMFLQPVIDVNRNLLCSVGILHQHKNPPKYALQFLKTVILRV